MTPLERVTERISRNGDIEDRDAPVPLLTLTEFFSGNEIVGSIGCNLIPTPLPCEFHELLASISRSEVSPRCLATHMMPIDARHGQSYQGCVEPGKRPERGGFDDAESSHFSDVRKQISFSKKYAWVNDSMGCPGS